MIHIYSNSAPYLYDNSSWLSNIWTRRTPCVCVAFAWNTDTFTAKPKHISIYTHKHKTLWQIERNQIGKRHRHEFPAHNCGTFYATAIHRTFYPQDDQTICFGWNKKKKNDCYYTRSPRGCAILLQQFSSLLTASPSPPSPLTTRYCCRCLAFIRARLLAISMDFSSF